MDIVVKGRNVEVPEHFRQHVQDKLAPSERLDPRAYHVDVELFHEKNPRQSKVCQRVEITGKGKGPVVRAEACGPDFYAALDSAVGKLEGRLRRSHDRRRVHHGRRQPTSVAEATAALAGSLIPDPGNGRATPTGLLDSTHEHDDDLHVPAPRWESTDGYGPGHIVREKEHSADPMTVDQALYEMELVGHDFYLFIDKDADHPAVVYRRKGYDYGVIRLTDSTE